MKIIIFSTQGLDPHRTLNLLNDEMARECDYISTPDGLFECLGRSRYDLIIIDSTDFACLDTLIKERIAAMEDLSVLLLRNGTGSTHHDSATDSKESILPRKMILHKGEERSSVQSNRDREIIRATAATLGHSINNPLMSIYASAEMILKENPALSSDAVEKIKRISDEVARIKKSTDILIDLDRVLLKMTPAGNMIDINQLITDKDTDDINREGTANKNLDIKPS